MMTKYLIGLFAALASTGASAASYVVTMQGTVAQQYATPFTTPGATSSIKVGDVISATFSFDDSQAVGTGAGRYYSLTGAHDAVFTLGGFTWTSGGDFLAGLSAPRVTLNNGVFGGYTGTMDDAIGGGDLRIRGFAFNVDEYGYDLYEGPGFRGSFDQASIAVTNGPAPFAVTAVPEAATWAQLITGFLVVGIAFRRSRVRRASWMSAVSRLSGRVRETA